MIAALVVLALAQTPGFDAGTPSAPVLVPIESLDAPAPAAEPAPAEGDEKASVEKRLEMLEDELRTTKAQVQSLQLKQSWLSHASLTFSGYLDFGFFFVGGDGSGVRTDLRGDVTKYKGQLLSSWVLVGDPLSTTINSRGDVADTGASRAIRFDPIKSGGRPTFIVNAVNLSMLGALSKDITFVGSIDFLIRDRNISNPSASIGDYFDLKVAYGRYQHAFDWGHIDVYAGKIESVLGVEYRAQDSDTRMTVTPSLICRYTCGRPVGLRANGYFFDDTLMASVSVTNGSNVIDGFPFSNDAVDFNRFKTVSGKLAVKLPVGRGLELGISGAYGPQDRQPDDSVEQWHYGFHALLNVGDFDAAAEFVTGRALGSAGGQSVPCSAAACLFYRGAYGLVGWHATPWLQPYVRLDWRAAEHRFGDVYAYESYVVRGTVGVKVTPIPHVIVKAEYTVIDETWPYDFDDNVFTSSLVLTF
jgi:hypothetical protein